MSKPHCALALLALPALMCGQSTAAADPELAPAELLKEHTALGLPLPPKTAKFVRYEYPRKWNDDNELEPPEYGLAFEVKPGTKTEGPILFHFLSEEQAGWNPPTREVKPDRDALKGMELGADSALTLAIQCQARGWTELAQECLKQYPKDLDWPPRKLLISKSEFYWWKRASHPTTDRAPIAKKIKELIGKYPEWDTEDNRALLKSLELALVPSKAKPGSVESLIDALVDCHADEQTGRFDSGSAYWQLADRGFDAVPALIEHLDDDRLTRAMGPGWQGLLIRHLRVRDLARDLIGGLAAEHIAGLGIGDNDSERFKRAAAGWWEKARKQNEETYLLENILPPPPPAEKGTTVSPNSHILRVIATKYPKQLSTVYRTVLDKRPEVHTLELVETLAKSSLPAKDKIDLFAYGAEHKDYFHRLWALGALKDLDKKRFDALLLATIESFPKATRGKYGYCPEGQVAALALESDEPRVWPALEKAAKRASVGLRMELLGQFHTCCELMELRGQLRTRGELRHRTELLRLLAAFLDDAEVRDIKADERFDRWSAGNQYERIEVRDFVALELAWHLGVDVTTKRNTTPAEWAKLREKVRDGLKRELDRIK